MPSKDKPLQLGTVYDEYSSGLLLFLVQLEDMTPHMITSIQFSHYRAQLLFSVLSRSTHLILAIHTHHMVTGANYVHCYALIYHRRWRIIDEVGNITTIHNSRLHQRIP